MVAAQSVLNTFNNNNLLTKNPVPAQTSQSIFSPVDTKIDINHPSEALLPEIPEWTPRTINRQIPLLIKMNRVLRALLISSCGIALLGYGLDVSSTAEVCKLQEQAQRLSEQNTELSAQLLKAISFQGIQAQVLGRAKLRVPDKVIITKEIKANPVNAYKSRKHFLPLMSGY